MNKPPKNNRLKSWVRKKLSQLILWACESDLRSFSKTVAHESGRAAAKTYCQILESQMRALQLLDVQYQSQDKFMGKIIMAARVGNQDFVQIIDVPPRLSLAEWKLRTLEIKKKFGAEVRYCDIPSHMREFAEQLKRGEGW